MNIGLERPIGLEAGHTYHIRLVVDDTIGTLYVDGVALNVRMYSVRASRWRFRHRRHGRGAQRLHRPRTEEEVNVSFPA